MRFRETIITLATLLLSCTVMYAEGGLGFYSYDVDPESRTELVIPEPSSPHVHFKRSLDFSFDFKLKEKNDVFGYVNRMDIDGTIVDLLVVKPRIKPARLVITSPGLEMKELGVENLRDWNRLEYHIEAVGEDSVRVNVNGTVLTLATEPAKQHGLRVYFGRCSNVSVFTNDVSPMLIREIDMKVSERQSYHWELKDWRDINKYNGLKISVLNPEWTIEASRHWEKILEYDSTEKIFHAVDEASGKVNIVSNGEVLVYDLATGQKKASAFADRMVPARLANDIAVLPDGSMAYVDLATDGVIINRYDPVSSRWELPVNRSSHSLYEHHNSFINPVDSSFVVLFGYGQHRYFNDLISIKDGESSTVVLDSIPPRYLSAVGLHDGYAYVLGGKGNPRGVQEYGIEIYDDIYRIRLSDYAVTSVGKFPNTGREVPADRLIIEENGDKIVALMYSPNMFKTVLHLVEYDMETGESRSLGDEISYDFLDVNSDATLFKHDGKYYAITVSKESSEAFLCQMYRIILPIDTDIVTQVEETQSNFIWLLYLLAAVVFLCGVGFVIFFEVRRRMSPVVEFKSENLSSGIHLLGAFRVIDADGNDVTASCTPTMRQLLALLVLTTVSGRGLSNAQMKDALWFDKSDESFFNNRGVNLAKLRNLMKQAGLDVRFVSENGVWNVVADDELCDYHQAVSVIRAMKGEPTDQTVKNILAISTLGTLLPDMRYGWLDKFKEDYDEWVIECIQNVLEKMVLDNEQVIALADALLVFDSLDETALRRKCRALLALKRSGVAKSAFANFTSRYESSMGESYPQNFSEFVK